MPLIDPNIQIGSWNPASNKKQEESMTANGTGQPNVLGSGVSGNAGGPAAPHSPYYQVLGNIGHGHSGTVLFPLPPQTVAGGVTYIGGGGGSGSAGYSGMYVGPIRHHRNVNIMFDHDSDAFAFDDGQLCELGTLVEISIGEGGQWIVKKVLAPSTSMQANGGGAFSLEEIEAAQETIKELSSK